MVNVFIRRINHTGHAISATFTRKPANFDPKNHSLLTTTTTNLTTTFLKPKKFYPLTFLNPLLTFLSIKPHSGTCNHTHTTNFPCTHHNSLSTTANAPTKSKQPSSSSTASTPKIMSAISKLLPNIVFVLGGPGSGKGTQCSRIMETFGFVHLSAGDLLREERNKPGSEYGELIEQHIRDGTIVPVEITCSLLERAMKKAGSKFFLIDGFPRNQNNLEGWEKQMQHKANILFVLFLDAPEEVCVSRCLSRGQLGSGRSDDNPESLKKRVATYVNDTMPIVKYFEEQSMICKVDASEDQDAVFNEIKAIFSQFLAQS